MKEFATTLAFLAIYFIYIGTFASAALQKWRSGLEDWFRTQFKNTILGKVPGGISLGFWSITVLETFTAFLFLIALIRLEFSLTDAHPFLDAATSLAALTFAILGIGLRWANDYQGAANLFIYFGTTIAVKIWLT